MSANFRDSYLILFLKLLDFNEHLHQAKIQRFRITRTIHSFDNSWFFKGWITCK